MDNSATKLSQGVSCPGCKRGAFTTDSDKTLLNSVFSQLCHPESIVDSPDFFRHSLPRTMHTSQSVPWTKSSDRPFPFNPVDPSEARRIQDYLESLATQSSDPSIAQHLRTWIEQLNWLHSFHQCSQMLVAAIEPGSWKIQYANRSFHRLLELGTDDCSPSAATDLRTLLQRLLSEPDFLAVQQLYRRHLLHLILREFYSIDASQLRLLEVPVRVTLPHPSNSLARHIEFCLRSDPLSITRLDPSWDEFAEMGLMQMAEPERSALLSDPAQLRQLEQQICLPNYRIQGQLLLEGLDVTLQELIHQTIQLLINRDPILRPHKFCQVDQQLRSLFRAQNSFILTIEANQFRVLTTPSSAALETQTQPIEALQSTCLMPPLQNNQVMIVPDLAASCKTEFDQQLLMQGGRSLLLIPLSSSVQIPGLSDALPPYARGMLGLVGIMSDRPGHFDGLDCFHAEQLIPAFTHALTSAQQQLVQQRFITNIHPAVEWRFLQEAERRSLGLPAAPIVFDHVYPLYGISDIRGSSETRNRAIQADLLAQLRLGFAVVEAVCQAKESTLGEQLRLDLLERIHELEQRITVDAEVTETRYLQNHLEVYFDYFAQCGEQARAAIATYQQACDNEQQCFYQARAEYDRTIGQINTCLKETWERWQHRMQQITPHYCDIETTDGMDHMIYAGQSIDPNFSKFQLRSLRYEQLRAMCACARTALQFQQNYDHDLQVTHLVLVQDCTVDIFHDETTEKLFDVRGTRDTRYEIVKKRIDKAVDERTQTRITQPEMLTLVYSTQEELVEYQQYLHYLVREGLIDSAIEQGTVEPLQGVTGLKFVRVRILPDSQELP